jgi:hypothetical protein
MDIESLPGWANSNEETRARILQAAKKYLQESHFRETKWFPSSNIPAGATSAVNALVLLYGQDAEYLESRTSAFWSPWVSALLSDLREPEVSSLRQTKLLQMANTVVNDEVIRCLLLELQLDSESHGYFLCQPKIEAVWSPQLEAALVAKIHENTLKENALERLLVFLFKRRSGAARKWAEESISCQDIGEERRVAIAVALLLGTDDAAWNVVWPQIERNPPFGRSVLERTSYTDGVHATFIANLSESDLGMLFIWLLEQYPFSNSGGGGFGVMGPADTIRFLRDGSLEQLKRRASFAACGALADAMTRFPGYEWLRFHLDEAETLACASTWQALPVEKILAAAANQNRRLVESSTQLLEVVIESLQRLQQKLHDELPAVHDLWNISNESVCWPKDEQAISDYVARHLKEDLGDRGIIANREVQIRRGRPHEMTGQNTDIHVDAITEVSRTGEIYGPVSLIVEVKGSWNQRLLDDMRVQLRDRYLRNNQCRTGVYCVVHFSANSWLETDYRRDRSRSWKIDALRKQLGDQAIALSGGTQIRSYVLDANRDSTAAKVESSRDKPKSE